MHKIITKNLKHILEKPNIRWHSDIQVELLVKQRLFITFLSVATLFTYTTNIEQINKYINQLYEINKEQNR